MEFIKGVNLVNKNKEKILAEVALKDIEIIAFYFSAHWCPPCRQFTPVVRDFYEEVKDQGEPLEIIFVSSDNSEEAQFDYMVETHGNWLAVPFGSPVAQHLKKQYKILGIPSLIVVKKDGTVVSTNGRSDIEKNGKNAYRDWSQ